MKFLKVLFWNLFFLGLFSLALFLAFESYLEKNTENARRSVSAVGIPIFVADSINTYAHKPGSRAQNGYGDPIPEISINNLGFRDEEFIPNPFQKNVLMLGDSFTFGTGIDQHETFTEKLEQRMNQLSPNIKENWEVWNAGHIGHSIDNYYLLAKKYEKVLDPELIIVNIFVANDITEFRRKEWLEADDDILAVKDLKIFVNKDDKLESWMQIRPEWLAWEELKKRLLILGHKWNIIRADKDQPTLTWPVFLSPQDEGYDDNLPIYWEKFFVAWERMVRWSEKKEVPVLYVFIPMDVQVDSVYDKKYAIMHFNEEAREADRPQTLMKKFCEARGLSCLDLLPEFRADKRRTDIFFQHNADPHFDRYGHQLVANILLDKILVKSQNVQDE